MKKHTLICIVCGNKNLKRVLEFGLHPLADTFLTKTQLTKGQMLYPLNSLLCSRCGHLQNEIFVSAQERYVDSQYSYTSANSPSARSHWDEFAETVYKIAELKSGNTVIEFGSNDGYLLAKLKQKGLSIAGIDPSQIADTANKKGIFTIKDFLSKKSLAKAVQRVGKADLICGNNVLNHIENLNEAIPIIKTGLKANGQVVIEVPSLEKTLQKYLFDMFFHEHVSIFSIRSLDYLFKINGLYITRVEDISYHGGSHRVYATTDINKYNQKLIKERVKQEQNTKLFDIQTYKDFMTKITKDKTVCLAKLYYLKKKGKKIAAVGAGARSNTLLNFYKLDPTIIEFVSDASAFKQGKYTPGSLIEIKNDTELKTQHIDVALITAWNIGTYLSEKIKEINPNIETIVPGKKELM